MNYSFTHWYVESKISRKEIMEATGISAQNLSLILTGNRDPTPPFLVQLEKYGLKPEEILVNINLQKISVIKAGKKAIQSRPGARRSYLELEPLKDVLKFCQRARNKSYVYLFKVIQDNVYKIGHSSNPKARFNTCSTYCPYPIEIYFVHEGTRETERLLHDLLNDYRTNREWFRLTDEMASEVVRVIKNGPE